MTSTLTWMLYATLRNPVTAVALPLIFGTLSGSGTRKTVRSEWYQSLRPPLGRPPQQVFRIIWPVLYIFMGYASHIAVQAFDEAKTVNTRSSLSFALALYYLQLAMNCLWSPLYFGAKKIGWALVDSVALLGINVYMTGLLHHLTDGKTSVFLVPYCAWLTFATYLNGGSWFLNTQNNGASASL
ncbi:hypothetical protein PAXINDRAFT_96476 [Paxillus involutus ATCC 200175]|nr:hypothetical protein PAXINDRAFT_96476 [Paxillus involutus ATCC 200175]